MIIRSYWLDIHVAKVGMPKGAHILDVQQSVHEGIIFAYAVVDPEALMVEVPYVFVRTGDKVPEGLPYLRSFASSERGGLPVEYHLFMRRDVL